MNYHFFNSSGTPEVSQNANTNTNATSGGDVSHGAPRLPSPQFRKSAPTPNSAGFQELYFPSIPQTDSFPDYPVKSTKPTPASNNEKNEEVSQISQLSKEYNTNLDLVLSKPEFQRNVPMFYLQEVGAFSAEEVQAALRKKVDKETKAVYGPLDEAKVGEVFNTRSELYKVHADVVNDVCSNGDYSKPATSVIIYDGEEHDDRGNMVLFVGDKISFDAKATQDEPLLEGANLALSRNSQLKIPIRLIRAAKKTTSAKATNPFAPMSGYRYDGVYFVGEYWFEKSPFSQDWVYVFKFIRVYGQPTLGSFVHFPISRKDVSIDLALGNAGPPSMKTNAFPSWSEVFSKSGDNNLISTYAPDESGKQKQKANNNTSDLLSLGGIYTTSNPVKEPVNTPNSFNKFMDNVTGFKMPDPQGGQTHPSNPYSLPSSYVNPSQFSTPYIPLPPTMAPLNSSKPPSPPSAPQPPSSRPAAIAPKPSPMPPIAPLPQQPPHPPQSRNAPIYPKPVPMQPNYAYPPVPQPQHQPPAPQYNPPQYMQMPPPPTPSLPSFGLPGSGRISDLKNVLSHDKIQDMLSSLRQKNNYQPRLDVPENIDALGRLPGGESSDPGNNSAVTSRNKQFFWNLGDPLLDKASMTKKTGKKRKQSISSATEESDYSSSGSSASSASPSQAKKKQKKTHKRTEQQQQQQSQQQSNGNGSAPVDLTTSPQNPQ